MLTRFEDVIQTLQRGSDDDIVEKCADLLTELDRVRSGASSVEMQLLDPFGHSQILHENAFSRELSEEEASLLDSGPMVPVFDSSELS